MSKRAGHTMGILSYKQMYILYNILCITYERGAEVRCPKRTGHPMGINQSAQPTQARPRERSELPEPRSGESEALKTTHNTD